MRARSRHCRSPAQFYKIPAAQRQHSAQRFVSRQRQIAGVQSRTSSSPNRLRK
jgi:hypothetical protein